MTEQNEDKRPTVSEIDLQRALTAIPDRTIQTPTAALTLARSLRRLCWNEEIAAVLARELILTIHDDYAPIAIATLRAKQSAGELVAAFDRRVAG